MPGATVQPFPPPEYTIHPSVSSFTEPQQDYVAHHPDPRFDHVATGTLVFDTSDPSVPRLLLIQRSDSDSMARLWEVPGGGCDDEDESILYAAARELWEEAGLKARHVSRRIGTAHFFSTRSGKKICRFNFIVEAETNPEGRFDVKLDPEEHQAFVWATEADVRAKRSGDVDLEFTTKNLEETILEAFKEVTKEA